MKLTHLSQCMSEVEAAPLTLSSAQLVLTDQSNATGKIIPPIESHGPPHVPKHEDKPAGEKKDPDPTTPPESTFKKLAPSRNRYTLLRDEL
ncbi:hypothetical protein LSH36_4g21001 [Paralvinella palmiformis]|uniref:Uncharacterized protein n=1 Tax=Paralvinella palmiformis TaxID=53620 RepID=A0AAD9KGL0_9ANNE|nr:hypothetical protein LSH36_4g21001 [Paralvinella palmiformis]